MLVEAPWVSFGYGGPHIDIVSSRYLFLLSYCGRRQFVDRDALTQGTGRFTASVLDSAVATATAELRCPVRL